MEFSSRTRLCAVIGHPIGHSLSPAIHNAAYRAMGEDMVYVAFDVPPAALAAAIEGMRAFGIRGLSVTIPHKEPLLPLLDEVSPTARAVGAVNTVVNEGGRLVGHTTDGVGACRALASHLGQGADYPLRGKTVLFLGAGGAARSLAFHFTTECDPPARVIVLGRTAARAEQLVRDLAAVSAVPAEAGPQDEARVAAAVRQADLIVNCCPIGMHPHTDATPIPAALLASGRMPDVFDSVPNPPETRLLQDARRHGCRTVPGIAMLVHQAAAQVELFTGRPAPVEAMFAAVAWPR